jgi:hypothetical protein
LQRRVFLRAHACARRRRSPVRSQHTVITDSGDSGDGSGQGDPDPSDPPKYPSFALNLTAYIHSFISPWPHHGCCCMARGWAA